MNGEDNFVVRGWHPTLIAEVLGMKVNGVGQSVFYDDQADYPYRGLVKGDDMPLVFEPDVEVDYYSLKASVLDTDQQMWNGLNAVHQTAKHAFDTRYFPFNASYLNDGFAVVMNGSMTMSAIRMECYFNLHKNVLGTSDGWSGAAPSVAEHAGRDVRCSAAGRAKVLKGRGRTSMRSSVLWTAVNCSRAMTGTASPAT